MLNELIKQEPTRIEHHHNQNERFIAHLDMEDKLVLGIFLLTAIRLDLDSMVPVRVTTFRTRRILSPMTHQQEA